MKKKCAIDDLYLEHSSEVTFERKFIIQIRANVQDNVCRKYQRVKIFLRIAQVLRSNFLQFTI